MLKILLPACIFAFVSCHFTSEKNAGATRLTQPVLFKKVQDIEPLAGYTRVALQQGSFGEWLRQFSLKKDKQVYLYNGLLKRNQTAQFAVLDISRGNKDLQQCADAVMRLKAEYHFSTGDFEQIAFMSTSGQEISFSQWRNGTRFRLAGNRLSAYQSVAEKDDRKNLDSYLEFVFTYCGTLSLAQQMKKVNDTDKIMPGDVFVKGGSPGHAMIVMDVATNKEGKKICMLAQSYMPAQDIHVVKNPFDKDGGPWYSTDNLQEIITPEWTFSSDQLYKW